MLDLAKKNNTVPENSASMIILLTDGDPNEGMSVLLMTIFMIVSLASIQNQLNWQTATINKYRSVS